MKLKTLKDLMEDWGGGDAILVPSIFASIKAEAIKWVKEQGNTYNDGKTDRAIGTHEVAFIKYFFNIT